jgi:hypothetical protein
MVVKDDLLEILDSGVKRTPPGVISDLFTYALAQSGRILRHLSKPRLFAPCDSQYLAVVGI